MSLKLEGLIKQDTLFNYIKISNFYITKTAGLSPTEAAAINVPLILLDTMGGHERENAKITKNRDQFDCVQ